MIYILLEKKSYEFSESWVIVESSPSRGNNLCTDSQRHIFFLNGNEGKKDNYSLEEWDWDWSLLD